MNLDWSSFLTWHNIVNLLDILVVWFVFLRADYATARNQSCSTLTWYHRDRCGQDHCGLRRVRDGFVANGPSDQLGCHCMIIIFQPEIRRGLEHLGRGSVFVRNRQVNEAEKQMIAALDKAIQYMSKRRIGALMTIQMDTGLEDYIETGIELDAKITGELLINIFIPNTPLHDGAVIIRNNKVAVAAAYLPLSDSNLIPKELGTRHRAAVGISEVTDALTIVISEETGEVSITKNNELLRNMDQNDYLKFLNNELIKDQEPEQPRNPLNWLIDELSQFFKGGNRQ